MEGFIPIGAVKTKEDRITLDNRTEAQRQAEIKRMGELGRRILADFQDNPDRDITICYFRHETKKNEGFIVLFDYRQWPRQTLRHRGYMNAMYKRGKVIRKANADEREWILSLKRLQMRTYKNFEQLIEDEKRCGSSDEFCGALRRKLNPTRDEITADHIATAAKMIEAEKEHEKILQQLEDDPQKGVWA